MAGTVKQIGEHTFRETFGRYYEDFIVGDIYEHRPGRTITQYDNISFTLLTMKLTRCTLTRSTPSTAISAAASYTVRLQKLGWLV